MTDTKLSKCSVDCATYQSGGEFYAQVTQRMNDRIYVLVSSRKSDKAARDLLGHTLSSMALKYEQADRNTQRAIIVCGDGEVLICSFRLNSWEYAIARKDMHHASITLGGWNSFDECYVAAQKHAGDFGGVVWTARM